MVHHLIILLLTIVYISTAGISSCELPKKNCLDEVPASLCNNPNINGTYHTDFNCSQLGYSMGSCCTDGCSISTIGFCFLFLGNWYPNDYSCNCPVIQSCCKGETCYPDYTKDECDGIEGSHDESSCYTDRCLPPLGACCAATCHNIPQKYCTGGKWYANTTCEEFCPNPKNTSIEVTTPGATGKCCNIAKCTETTETECTSKGGIFTGGMGCSVYSPCLEVGACLRQGVCVSSDCNVTKHFCFSPVTRSLCNTYGGTFLAGGTCDNGPIGVCNSSRECNLIDKLSCDQFEMDWVPGDTCPAGYPPIGACCLEGLCMALSQLSCTRLSGVWNPNVTNCSLPTACGYQPLGHCCMFGLCDQDLEPSEANCYFKLILGDNTTQNSEVSFLSQPICPVSGFCGSKSIEINGKDVNVQTHNEFLVNSGNITINSSSVIIGSISFNASHLGVNSTTLKLGELITTDTGLNFTHSNLTMTSGILNGATITAVASIINVNGNFTLNPTSIIIVDPDSQIILKGCGDIQGTIQVDLSKYKTDIKKSSFTLLNSTCVKPFDANKITFINYAQYSDPCLKETLTPKFSSVGIEILVDYSAQSTCQINTQTKTNTGSNVGTTGSLNNSGNYLFISVVIAIIMCLF